jgi:hypothetical protein
LALVFTRRTDRIVRQLGITAALFTSLGVAGFYYYALPGYTRVGFQPEQPVPFSHRVHAGNLGMDCRYCHTNVEESPFANLPTTQTCMNCHNPDKANVKGNSPLLAAVRESWATGSPVPWKQIHKLPEYAYFNHAAHVTRGVSCVSCHGPVNEMPVVYHAKVLSMGFCLNCHREPEVHVRDPKKVYDLTYQPAQDGKTQTEIGTEVADKLKLNPPQSCQGCHR